MSFTIVFFVATGLTLLGLLLVLLLGAGEHARTDGTPEAAASSLNAAAFLRSNQLGERIFSPVDLEFISGRAPALRQKLVRERRQIACFWIAQKKKDAKAVMALHRLTARTNKSLSPRLEFELAATYYAFLSICELVDILVWLRGPFASRRTISSLFTVGDRLKALSDALLGGAQPVETKPTT